MIVKDEINGLINEKASSLDAEETIYEKLEIDWGYETGTGLKIWKCPITSWICRYYKKIESSILNSLGYHTFEKK